MCVNVCMCVLTALSCDDDHSDQQGGTQHDQADGGESVRLDDGQWANWLESGTNWEENMMLVLILFYIVSKPLKL